MKKLLISAAATVALVTGLVLGLHSMSDIDPILEANIEALTSGEGGLSDPIWVVYHRPDGGFNCTRGGNETC